MRGRGRVRAVLGSMDLAATHLEHAAALDASQHKDSFLAVYGLDVTVRAELVTWRGPGSEQGQGQGSGSGVGKGKGQSRGQGQGAGACGSG